MHERTVVCRSVQARYLKPVERLGWIGKRDVHRASGKTCSIQQLENRGRTAVTAVHVIHRVGTRVLTLDEVEDSMLTLVFACNESGPSGRGDWRQDRLQRGGEPLLH